MTFFKILIVFIALKVKEFFQWMFKGFIEVGWKVIAFCVLAVAFIFCPGIIILGILKLVHNPTFVWTLENVIKNSECETIVQSFFLFSFLLGLLCWSMTAAFCVIKEKIDWNKKRIFAFLRSNWEHATEIVKG